MKTRNYMLYIFENKTRPVLLRFQTMIVPRVFFRKCIHENGYIKNLYMWVSSSPFTFSWIWEEPGSVYPVNCRFLSSILLFYWSSAALCCSCPPGRKSSNTFQQLFYILALYDKWVFFLVVVLFYEKYHFFSCILKAKGRRDYWDLWLSPINQPCILS